MYVCIICMYNIRPIATIRKMGMCAYAQARTCARMYVRDRVYEYIYIYIYILRY